MEGKVINDDGGASLVVKLNNRNTNSSIHKGMVYVKKHSDAWKHLNHTNRDLHEFQGKTVTFQDESTVDYPAANTRSKRIQKK